MPEIPHQLRFLIWVVPSIDRQTANPEWFFRPTMAEDGQTDSKTADLFRLWMDRRTTKPGGLFSLRLSQDRQTDTQTKNMHAHMYDEQRCRLQNWTPFCCSSRHA